MFDHSIEVVPVSVDEEDLQQGGEEAHADALRVHGDVVEQDDDDDGAEDGEGYSDVSADEQQHACDDVERTDEGEPAVFEHDGEEGSRVSGRQLHREEVKETIEAKDGEHEA